MAFKVFIVLLLTFVSLDSKAMEVLGFADEGADIVAGDELSECGKKIAEFKFFLRDGKRCVRDTDCIVIAGTCPLGCKFYINKNFEAILSSRIEEVAEVCKGSVCSAVCTKPEDWPSARCDNNKCVADI